MFQGTETTSFTSDYRVSEGGNLVAGTLDSISCVGNFLAAPLTSIATACTDRRLITLAPSQSGDFDMKRLALVAAVLALAACTKKDEAPVDTGAAMAPAPAAMDTGMKMMDSTAMTDTTKKDTTAMADTTKKTKK
jgi:hypothetical protein